MPVTVSGASVGTKMGLTRTPDIRPFLDQVLVGDCLSELAKLPPKSVDLVFADPPYNLQLAGDLKRPNQTLVDGVEEPWDRFASFAEYDAFTRAWLAACRRVMTDTATLWAIGSYHNVFRVGAQMQDLGFWILNDVVWRKTNPMPNFRGRRFTNAHETLIWAMKDADQKTYRFNYDAMKALNDGLQMRSDWLLPICTGSERLKDAAGAKIHPTQKPEALLHRVILAASRPGDVVLDPFFGTGTTGVVAKRLGRHFVGVERHPPYVAAALERLEATACIDDAALAISEGRRAERRIPFGMLVERSLILPGELLHDPLERHAARVRADGTIACRDASGSIHQIGAHVQGAEACNGWTFWHIRRSGRLIPIDLLRQALRTKLTRDGA